MIGICGGIGSGKSVVSRILRLRGEPVYDCDLEAKRIMDGSEEVLNALNEKYGDAVCPKAGPICRPELAKRVFSSEEDRLWLNALVHRLVRDDVKSWQKKMSAEAHPRCFVESAILASSGLARMCDEVWIVTASEKVRIDRIKMRDSLNEEAISKRIQSQKEEERIIADLHLPTKIIDNSNDTSLLNQIN